MVKHCIFPNCNPNYVSRNGTRIGEKVRIFRLPKNEEECALWLKAIPLKKKINSETSFICERHWPTGYAKVSKKGKERPRDPPTVWPNHPDVVPPSQRSTLPPNPRPTSRTSLVIRGTQPCEMASFRVRDVVNFEDIQVRVSSETNQFCCQVTSYESGRNVIIQSTTTFNGVPTFMVQIHEDLKFSAFHLGVKVSFAKFRLVNLCWNFLVYLWATSFFIYFYRKCSILQKWYIILC